MIIKNLCFFVIYFFQSLKSSENTQENDDLDIENIKCAENTSNDNRLKKETKLSGCCFIKIFKTKKSVDENLDYTDIDIFSDFHKEILDVVGRFLDTFGISQIILTNTKNKDFLYNIEVQKLKTLQKEIDMQTNQYMGYQWFFTELFLFCDEVILRDSRTEKLSNHFRISSIRMKNIIQKGLEEEELDDCLKKICNDQLLMNVFNCYKQDAIDLFIKTFNCKINSIKCHKEYKNIRKNNEAAFLLFEILNPCIDTLNAKIEEVKRVSCSVRGMDLDRLIEFNDELYQNKFLFKNEDLQYVESDVERPDISENSKQNDGSEYSKSDENETIDLGNEFSDEYFASNERSSDIVEKSKLKRKRSFRRKKHEEHLKIRSDITNLPDKKSDKTDDPEFKIISDDTKSQEEESIRFLNHKKSKETSSDSEDFKKCQQKPIHRTKKSHNLQKLKKKPVVTKNQRIEAGAENTTTENSETIRNDTSDNPSIENTLYSTDEKSKIVVENNHGFDLNKNCKTCRMILSAPPKHENRTIIMRDDGKTFTVEQVKN